MCLIHSIGGAFTRRPEELAQKLSAKASDVVKRAFDDIDPQRLIDHHVHVAGLGAGGTFVNRKMRTWAHPFHRLVHRAENLRALVRLDPKADRR